MDLITIERRSGLEFEIGVDIEHERGLLGHSDGDVSVSVTFELRPDPKRIAAVTVDVELPDGVSPERRAAAGRVVEHCLLRETLNDPPDVDVDVLMEN